MKAHSNYLKNLDLYSMMHSLEEGCQTIIYICTHNTKVGGALCIYNCIQLGILLQNNKSLFGTK